MKPKLLYNGIRPLCVLCEDGEEVSSLERELDDYQQSAQTVRHAASIRIIMQRFARGEQLPSQMFHKAGKIHGIQVYEFIKQPIRIYCVSNPNLQGCFLLSHSVLKKWQKTKPADLEKTYRQLQNMLSLEHLVP
ncbi:hypothetical protein A7P95_00600 [Eikenella longinqua]|uniref:Type II toxin-antitoxin system RelE/ParE family toxin n=1 Tax=Eikenella longinqua TaxID=1795827 RepID=A0A1A9S2D4_9NEIS|nr:hypothetical protein A7P95_00600 [Eikenella longinqua]